VCIAGGQMGVEVKEGTGFAVMLAGERPWPPTGVDSTTRSSRSVTLLA
jgi:hypothetical protein